MNAPERVHKGYVDELDETVEALRARGTPVLQEPVDQPWGERTA